MMAIKTTLRPRERQRAGNTRRKGQRSAQPNRLATLLAVMWHRFKNLFFNLKNHDLLSPDLATRRQVRQTLRHRPRLGLREWFEVFCKSCQGAYPVVDFLYSHLETYSGLELAVLVPSDRLEEDLHWTDVCSFDWQIALCDDFMYAFGVDMTQCVEDFSPRTVEELILLLQQQLQRR
jgi:hypothetical protein